MRRPTLEGTDDVASNLDGTSAALAKILALQAEDIPEDINGLALAHHDKALLSINRHLDGVERRLASIEALLRTAVGGG